MPRLDIQLVPRMNRESPGHLLHSEGRSYARVLNNLRPDRGELARRPGMVAALANLPTRDGLAGTFKIVHIEELVIEPGIRGRYLLATEKELFIGSSDPVGSGWDEITPIYTTGTVTVTNGSKTVTGAAAPLWRTRGIYGGTSPDGCWFKGPDGVWHNIASVDSETQITLSTNYGGATLAGQAYTIKRTLNCSPPPNRQDSAAYFIYTWRLNQDLYVAGPVSGAYLSTLGATFTDGGVLKVTDALHLLKTTFSAADVSYLFSGMAEAEAGIDFAGDRIDIYGFGGLSDGRLVVVGQAFDDASPLTASARVYYSSHLAPAVWTTAPGGATDVIDYQGAVTGASFSTVSIAVHFGNGIEVAELTGQDDPPLRFRPSRAFGVGAIGPRMIARPPQGRASGGSEVFLGSDGRFYSWNGISIAPLTASGLEYEILDQGSEIGPQAKLDARLGFAVVDSRRNEVAWFIPHVTQGLTREIRWSYENGDTWRGVYSGEIYAGLAFNRTHPDNIAWIFAPEAHNLLLGTDTATSWLWRTSEDVTSDAYSGGGDTGGIYALFEGIAFAPEEEWVIQEILVYCRAPFNATPAATTWKLKWYGDGKPAGQELTASVTPTRTAYENDAIRPECVAIFKSFDEVPVRELSFILASNDDNVLAANITRITIFVSPPTADVRAT